MEDLNVLSLKTFHFHYKFGFPSFKMLPKVFLIYFLLLKEFALAVHCNNRTAKSRQHYRNLLNDKGTVYMIFAYSELVVYPDSDTSKLSLQNWLGSELLMPIFLSQQIKNFQDDSELEIFRDKAKKRRTGLVLNFEVKYGAHFQIEDQCSAENIDKIYVYSAKWPDKVDMFLFRACKMEEDKDGNSLIKEAYVILSRTTSIKISEVTSKLFKNTKFNYLKYDEFNNETICSCDDLEFYINDCAEHSENGSDLMTVGVLAGCSLLLVILFKTLEFFKRKNQVMN
jgi:hypothetical protein